MSVILKIICDNKFGFKYTRKFAEETIQKVKKINLELSQRYDGTIHKRQKWEYRLENYTKGKSAGKSIRIMGNAIFDFNIFKNAVIIGSHFKYWIIFDKDDKEWFLAFRKEVFKIITFFGATEIIYLMDNYDHLCVYYLDIEEGLSYEEVKSKLLKDYGSPVTDYSKLNLKRNRKGNLKQYFLDDFKDLK